MAKDTLILRFDLQAPFETIQDIRRLLAEETIRDTLVSRLSDMTQTWITHHTNQDVLTNVDLKVSRFRKPRSGSRSLIPQVKHDLLTWYDEYEQKTNIVGKIGSIDALAWLQAQGPRSFRYESNHGSFTAIRENRRGRPVWYAHRRHTGQLKRVYLGKSENLTPSKLAQAARKLNPNLTEP